MGKIPSFNIIVAACDNGGIGWKGALPWSIKSELRNFAKLTTETKDASKQNAVIMGRNTWLSIPEKFRPLRNRINVVVSRTLKDSSSGVLLANSIENALDLLRREPIASKLESVWIIGGQSLYKYALESPCLHRVYFTRIFGPFECDAFFPVDSLEKMEKVEGELPREIQEENGIRYQYEVYQKS